MKALYPFTFFRCSTDDVFPANLDSSVNSFKIVSQPLSDVEARHVNRYSSTASHAHPSPYQVNPAPRDTPTLFYSCVLHCIISNQLMKLLTINF